MSEMPSEVFFDLGDTLGSAVLSPPPVHLIRFDPFPFTQSLLTALRAKGLRLGIISNTGADGKDVIDAVLSTAGILDFFEPALRLYSHEVGLIKDSPAIFLRAAELAGHVAEPEQCLFVGEDATERAFAMRAGLRVCPHPLLIEEVIAGESLRYVRVTIPAGRVQEGYGLLRQRALVPLHVAGPGGRVVYGITSQRVATEFINFLLHVDLLGSADAPDGTDLYLLRDDLAKTSGFGASAGAARQFFAGDDSPLLLSATEEGLVVALPAGRSPGEFHFSEARHGHTLKLIADPHLLEPATGGSVSGFAAQAAELTPEEQQALTNIGSEAVLAIVQRYSGIRPLASGAPKRIRSRHIADAGGDNERAVMALIRDLEVAGRGLLQVRLGRFSHRGLTLHNVEAELPGTSPELVLITAHLDSTAANDPGFNETHGAAPGADDDASGVAAVVLAAECFARLAAAGAPVRTLRFVLFNAEEEGLIGSRIYARQQRALQAPIVAVFQMDMIGYHERAPRAWEVHAGYAPSAEIQARSLNLARLLGQVAPLVSPALEPPQVYGANDPAAGRSDHGPFQAHGYAACVVSEDFFIGPAPDSPAPQPNPNYHRAGDTVVVADFAADIARAVVAAAWILAKGAAGAAPQFTAAPAISMMGRTKMAARQIDTGNFLQKNRPVAPAAAPSASGSRRLRLNVRASSAEAPDAAALSMDAAAAPQPFGSTINRALAVLRRARARAAGFTAAQPSDGTEFVPDPMPQQTSSAAQVVHFQQFYRGVPVFRTAHTVRFAPEGQGADVLGDDVVLTTEVNTAPTLVAEQAVAIAAKHLASAGQRKVKDEFGQEATQEAVKLDGFMPKVIAGFPTLPSQPAVVDWVATAVTDANRSEKPFSKPVPAHLLIFDQPVGPRLAWYGVFTREDQFEQYAVIVSADQTPGEILYVRDMMHMAQARGAVFEFSPGIADRRMTDFPRPIGDYPVMPGVPIVGFPADWVEEDKTVGNSTVATLNFTSASLTGVLNGNAVEFNPGNQFGDDQKLLNIFYFCNYMHDFLYILGFDEAAGNFQKVSFAHMGVAGDPVRARAHSGAVRGTANMSTAADGTPPLMNMGLVERSNRHTALDADVVFHEFTHGLTNRLVGGTRQGHTLDAPQSQGMGEGWSDFFALTIQNFFRARNGQNERVVTGDWVVHNQTGIRSNPYDDHYPFTYGNVSTFPRFDPETGFPDPNGLPDEHQTGEIWCAALMMMVRRIRAALGDVDGYRLGWQLVVDGLKLSPANPTFLDARDAILLALDQMLDRRRIQQAVHNAARQAALAAFGRFGMGPNASSIDAGVDGIVEDVVQIPVA
jgi:hypothetical protein